MECKLIASVRLRQATAALIDRVAVSLSPPLWFGPERDVSQSGAWGAHYPSIRDPTTSSADTLFPLLIPRVSRASQPRRTEPQPNTESARARSLHMPLIEQVAAATRGDGSNRKRPPNRF
jgi:hypothetical protein